MSEVTSRGHVFFSCVLRKKAGGDVGYFIEYSSVVTLRRRKHIAQAQGVESKTSRSIGVLLVYLHF